MRRLLIVMTLASSLTFAASGAAQDRHQDHQMMQNCPMKLEGVTLSVTDVEGGIALSVTTKTGDVAELRRRVESMAKMHSEASGNSIPFFLKHEEISGGVLVSVNPKDPAQLEELRALVRKHAEKMQNGGCFMMQGMGHGMMNGHGPAPPEPSAPSGEDHSGHHPVEGK